MVCLVIFRPFSGACGAQGILYNGINMRSCTRKNTPLKSGKKFRRLNFFSVFLGSDFDLDFGPFGAPSEGPVLTLEEELRRSPRKTVSTRLMSCVETTGRGLLCGTQSHFRIAFVGS